MKVPVSSVDFSESLQDYFEKNASMITPGFPNWEKSFVSGPQSPLFNIEHRIDRLNPDRLITRVEFKLTAEGPPGHIHGGASAGLIDECMGVLVWHHQLSCLTQTLQLSYLKILPLQETAFVVTQIQKKNLKTVEVLCTIYGKEKTPYVSSQGVFHRLTVEQLEKFIALRNLA